MAPTLRSATNTPTKNVKSTEATPTTTPTKRCKICKRPRLGHPRSGCPYGPAEEENTNEPPEDMSQALESLNLTDDELEDTKAAIRNRRRRSSLAAEIKPSVSLESLSTTSSQILNDLAKPGIFDNGPDDAEEKVAQLRIGNYMPKGRAMRKENQTLMPCTFATPSPESSYASIPSHRLFPTPNSSQTEPAEPASSQRAIHRTMSMEEQTGFIDQIRQMSGATAYCLPLADIPSIQGNAMKLGLHSHLVHIDDQLKVVDATEGLLVIGRDGKAVQALVEKLERDAKKHVAKGGRVSGFRAAAGGVVVGAAATFAGLAFA